MRHEHPSPSPTRAMTLSRCSPFHIARRPPTMISEAGMRLCPLSERGCDMARLTCASIARDFSTGIFALISSQLTMLNDSDERVRVTTCTR